MKYLVVEILLVQQEEKDIVQELYCLDERLEKIAAMVEYLTLNLIGFDEKSAL